MAERKSGPVKPPVIDLKAREASDTPASGTGAEAPPKATTRSRGTRARGAAGRSETAPETPSPIDDASPASSAEQSAPPETAAAPQTAADAPPIDPPTEPPTEAAAPTASSAGAEPPGASAPPPPRPSARLAMPWSAISIAAVSGALLGAGLTYLAANWIALPRQPPPFADPAPALAELDAATTALDTRLTEIADMVRDTRVGLDATVAQLDTAVTDLGARIAAVQEAIPEPEPVDLSGIQGDLQTLESRVAAIAAGASSDDASALAQNLTGLETAMAALAGRLEGIETRFETDNDRLAGLAADLAETRAALAAQTRSLGGADIGPAVKLPLIVSGLEAAFANGRPYTAELDGLTALLPDLSVPTAVSEAAATGLARPDALATRFQTVLPDIIAGRARDTTGDWAQDALEWGRALLALRPAEEMEGDTPEAIVSRLESAVARRDYVVAAALLAQLPAPMRQAAGPVGTDIAAHAQAETFVARLRTEALAPATEPAS